MINYPLLHPFSEGARPDGEPSVPPAVWGWGLGLGADQGVSL